MQQASKQHHGSVSMPEACTCRPNRASASAGGRDAASLEPLLRHLQHHLCDPRHARLLTDVGHRLLDMYGGVVSALPLHMHA